MSGPLRIVETGVIYDTGLAQLAGAAEVAADGSIVVAFNRRTDAAVGNVGLIWRSSDLGKTWHDTGRRLKCEYFQEGPIHVALGMSRLGDGRLLLPYCDFASGRRSADDHPRHMKNQPRASVLRMVESRDDGQSWSPPRDVHPPGDFDSWYLYGKLRCLADGRLVLPVCACRTRDGHGQPDPAQVGFLISHDAGQTWPEMRTIVGDGADRIDETDMIVLPGGQWLAVSRQVECEMLTTRSTDEGRTWLPLTGMGIDGHSPSLLMMPSGRLYLACRKVSDWAGKTAVEAGGRAGLGVWWSDDADRTWQGELTLDDPKGYRYRFGHETGMPCMLHLPDGRIMVVFYSYDPNLPYEPEDPVWAEVAHFYKRYIAFNIVEEQT